MGPLVIQFHWVFCFPTLFKWNAFLQEKKKKEGRKRRREGGAGREKKGRRRKGKEVSLQS